MAFLLKMEYGHPLPTECGQLEVTKETLPPSPVGGEGQRG
jgi:hypothetical protein